jgi:hypothetical protein
MNKRPTKMKTNAKEFRLQRQETLILHFKIVTITFSPPNIQYALFVSAKI